MNYSFVIPIHNEEGNLEPLLVELDGLVAQLHGPVEVICVDDGSEDKSRQVLLALKARFPYMKLIFFDCNYGQSAGFDAGIRQATGDIIITMDADLQNDPADVLTLLQYYPAYDVVIGSRTRRQDTLVKRLSSKIGNAVRNFLTNEDIADTGCSLKIFKRETIQQVTLFTGLHRFLPTLCRMHGARVKEVPVAHRPRLSGRSHYGIGNRAWRGLMDTLAVRWMLKRALHYTIEKTVP
jgi:glycosyltransferase involved in cell wall biosynthesis